MIKTLSDLVGRPQGVFQHYMENPLTVNGYKLDLRIYLLVTSLDPFIYYLYNDGLVRLATRKYRSPAPANLGDLKVHLTNTNINSEAENLIVRTDDGSLDSKQSLSWLQKVLNDAASGEASFTLNVNTSNATVI